MGNKTTKKRIMESIQGLEKWVEDHAYKSYEPFDGLSSYLHFLTFNNLFLERILQQVVRRCPINIRPIIGVSKKESTKGRGYMAWGYITMYTMTKDKAYLDKAAACLKWLDKNKSPFYEKHSWGNHFSFSSRVGKLPKLEPIIVWTSLIGQAFIDMYELTKEQFYLDVIQSICDWILALPREKTDSGVCLSYVAFCQRSIHNSNMLGAAMLARSARYIKNPELKKAAQEGMKYSCTRQLPDGAWWYGEADDLHWIDNFHTGYNLDSLKCYIDATGDKEYESQLKKGFDFFKKSFFEADGAPKYYHDRTYPIDSQCMSQAIETLARFSDLDKESLDLGIKVALWAIDNMQDKKKGHFYFRKYSTGLKNKIPMLHWAEATMYKALVLLYSKM
jgi:polysaccharide biosynthesis protein VpsJ